MREYYKKIKEFLADPKKKSLTLVVIYAIFFAFVFLYIYSYKTINTSVENNDENIVDEEKEQSKDVNSYEFNYEINIDDNIIYIEGTYYNKQQLLKTDNKKYYIKNEITYLYDEQLVETTIDYPINNIEYNKLYNLISTIDYESKTEYKDESIKYEYIISNEDYANYYNEESLYEGNIYITVYENNFINQVDIDLSSYYNMNKYIISINYNNINNINNLDINSDLINNIQ